eukprot:jgi/Hompol1/5284/HPOL_002645-RA
MSKPRFSCSASFKKKPGELLLTSTGLTWRDSTASTASGMHIKFEAVKSQQISKAAPSAKVILKLMLVQVPNGPDSVSFTFDGPNPENDREQIKDAISKRLAAALSQQQQSQNTAALRVQDLEARSTLLSRNKELARLHKDLVMGGLIGEEDFWNTRKQTIVNQEFQTTQKRGTSSSSLADIKPTAVDENGADVKFTLTPEIIHSIFTESPGVHKAFEDFVPDKMTETEFWTQYLSSKHFHRNRNLTGVNETKDIFDDYIVENERDMRFNVKGLAYTAKNQLLDLTTTAEDHTETGNRPDMTMRAGGVRTSLPLIRKFNWHSQSILKSSLSLDTHVVYTQETLLEDLEPVKENSLVLLRIQDPTKYFDTLSQAAGAQQTARSATLNGNLSAFYQQITAWKLGISRAHELGQKRRANEASINFNQIKKLKSFDSVVEIQTSCNELLRHFWRCFADYKKGNSTVLDKLQRIVEALKRHLVQMNAVEVKAGEDRPQTSAIVFSARSAVQRAVAAFPA